MTLHGRQAEAAQVGPDGKAVWSRGFGAWGRTGSDGNAARLNHSTGGFLLGTDARLSQHWRAGALAGYSRTRFDVGNASGSSDNFHLGLYGGAQWGRLGLRLGAAHTWHALRVSRPVAFAGYADALKADYRAGTTRSSGTWAIASTRRWRYVEPFVSAAYVNLRTGRIDERGGAAALRARGQDTGVGYTTLGLRASGAFTLGRAGATRARRWAGAMRWGIRRWHRHSDLRGRRVHGGRRADREECRVDRGRHGCDAGPGDRAGPGVFGDDRIIGARSWRQGQSWHPVLI
ncbi:autotransporter domain-containing protein [Achromobacter xylosoxidans]